MTVPDLMYEW